MQSKKSSIRHIKIQLRFIDQGRYKYCRSELRLRGKWLEDFGFTHGKIVTIRCSKNKLILIVN